LFDSQFELFEFVNLKKDKAMYIHAEKMEIIKMIIETENPGIIDSIKKIFKKEHHVDFWETLPQDQKDDILLGIKEIEDGEVVDYDEFIKKYV